MAALRGNGLHHGGASNGNHADIVLLPKGLCNHALADVDVRCASGLFGRFFGPGSLGWRRGSKPEPEDHREQETQTSCHGCDLYGGECHGRNYTQFAPLFGMIFWVRSHGRMPQQEDAGHDAGARPIFLGEVIGMRSLVPDSLSRAISRSAVLRSVIST